MPNGHVWFALGKASTVWKVVFTVPRRPCGSVFFAVISFFRNQKLLGIISFCHNLVVFLLQIDALHHLLAVREGVYVHAMFQAKFVRTANTVPCGTVIRRSDSTRTGVFSARKGII